MVVIKEVTVPANGSVLDVLTGTILGNIPPDSDHEIEVFLESTVSPCTFTLIVGSDVIADQALITVSSTTTIIANFPNQLNVLADFIGAAGAKQTLNLYNGTATDASIRYCVMASPAGAGIF